MAKNTMMLYGKNSVKERLKENPQTIRKIFLHEGFNVPSIEKLIQERHIPVERLSSTELSKKRPFKDIQGILAKVERFQYVSFYDLLNKADKEASFIFLDRLSDPQNLGVIIRTAACFGKFSIVIPKYKACEVTEAVLHVASGGENYVPVSLVPNISRAIMDARECGYWIMGGVVSGKAQNLNEISIPFPIGLVLGSEGEGIRYGIQKHLDIKVRIPMEGAELSLNVAMSCAILCYEIAKQRGFRCE